ncbi:MAG: hypothetical protein Q4F65_11460, partial [Propionibacteriaceae bacterium]|nr:hypothetical protein [Propionibacteriaceae bacterium]
MWTRLIGAAVGVVLVVSSVLGVALGMTSGDAHEQRTLRPAIVVGGAADAPGAEAVPGSPDAPAEPHAPGATDGPPASDTPGTEGAPGAPGAPGGGQLLPPDGSWATELDRIAAERAEAERVTAERAEA